MTSNSAVTDSAAVRANKELEIETRVMDEQDAARTLSSLTESSLLVLNTASVPSADAALLDVYPHRICTEAHCGDPWVQWSIPVTPIFPKAYPLCVQVINRICVEGIPERSVYGTLLQSISRPTRTCPKSIKTISPSLITSLHATCPTHQRTLGLR